MKRIIALLIAAAVTLSAVHAVEVTTDLPITGIGRTISTDVRAKKPYTIACIVKNSTNPYMVGILNGVKKAGEDIGFKAILMAPATNDSVEEQVKIMEDLMQKGVDAFILSCVDTNGIMPGVRKAMRRDIPIASIATPPAVEAFLRTGVDYVETGVVVTDAIARKIGEKGDIIVVEGPPGAQNSQERLAGIKKALEKYPEMKLVASQTANFHRVQGMQVVENLLQRFKDVAAIIALNDEMAIGAIQALKAAGLDKKVVVAGFDANEDAAYSINNDELYITYNTDPYGSGYLASTYLVQFLNDGVKPPQYEVPFPSARDEPLITRENVEKFIAEQAWWRED